MSAELLSELARAKALFQARAIAAALQIPLTARPPSAPGIPSTSAEPEAGAGLRQHSGDM